MEWGGERTPRDRSLGLRYWRRWRVDEIRSDGRLSGVWQYLTRRVSRLLGWPSRAPSGPGSQSIRRDQSENVRTRPEEYARRASHIPALGEQRGRPRVDVPGRPDSLLFSRPGQRDA